MSKKSILFFSIFSSLLILSSCSSGPPPLDPGRCRVHTDCPQGQECTATRCQDLYHPRHKIKNY